MRLLIAFLLSFAVLGAATAHAETVWLCEPGVAPNPCDESQETTVQGVVRETVETPKPGKRRIDCFYVYPTVSEQTGVNANKDKDPQQIRIAQYQAARFSLRCRVFAPMYRQLTLSSIYTGSPEARAEGRKIAYADVREAWLDYLRNDNHGRGVVLIGHSQGTGMLRQLMRQEVDPKPRVRRRLVSALLLGGNVLVRAGETTGGDFANVPLCTDSSQFGCTVAFSIFGDPPPGNTRFGKAPATDITGAGLPAGPEYEVACTNPAALEDNTRSTFKSVLRSEPFPGLIGAALVVMYGGLPPTADTPWLAPRDRYEGRCERIGGAHVLLVRPIGASRELNGAPTPDWGLHLADVNLPLADLVELVGEQASAYLARRPRLRCRPGRRITGLDRALVQGVAKQPGGRVRVALADGRKVRLKCA